MKRYLEIGAHLIFWLLTGYLFMKYSFIRPTLGKNLELFSTFLIICSIYINYFILYPYVFKKNKRVLYIILSLVTVVIAAIIESAITKPIVYKTLFLDEKLMRNYIQSIYFFIFLRNFGFLLFFVILKFYLEALKVNRLEKEKFTIENTYLRSRIAPHFLYNVLNSIYADAIIKDEKLPDYILQLSKLLHYYVDESHREMVSLNDEIQFYKRYIELENKRFDHKVQIRFNTNITREQNPIAPLLFEPIISNGFKYVPKDGSGQIEISIHLNSQNEIHFNCVNTKWNDTKQITDTTSKGLCTLKSRLQLLYPNKHKLTISDTDATYEASLIIRLNE
ncbi:MAG: histidine kinase [Bacteroidales bacterium]|nr:histidine kinase [Bacteroidales bacterium]